MDNTPLWYKKFKYKMDTYMARGIAVQLIMLGLAILTVVLITGLTAAAIEADTSSGMGLWQSLMHIIDPGTITGDDTENIGFLAVMAFVTAAGMILTGTLIGIINSAVSKKLEDLRKGRSQIIEEDHTVILGFDDDIYCLLDEIIMSNEHKDRGCVVIIANRDKEEMEQLLKNRIPDFGNTDVICRSGKPIEESMLAMGSVENAKSIIINENNDFHVLRILLGLGDYLEAHRTTLRPEPTITTLLHKQQSINSARIATKGHKAELLFFEDTIAKLIAQVCRQPGLSKVLSELFSYAGSEFYFSNKCQMVGGNDFVGKTFNQVVGRYANAIVVGFRRKKKLFVNPDIKAPLQPGDELLVIAAEGKIDKSATEAVLDESKLRPYKALPNKAMHMLVLEWNDSLPAILQNLDDFVLEGSTVTVASDRPYDISKLKYEHITANFIHCEDMYSRSKLAAMVTPEITNVLLVSHDGISKEGADAQTAMLLLNLRSILSERKDNTVNVTTEMKLAEDQQLLQSHDICDFVVGSEIANRVMVQIANEPMLHELFIDLLTADESDIYLRKAQEYVDIGDVYTFRQLCRLVNRHGVTEVHEGKEEYRGDVVIGWKVNNELQLNPPRDVEHTFTAEDELVIMSRN